MKSTKRMLAVVLALVLLLTPMVSVSAAETSGEDILYCYDLEAFLNELPSSQVQYDYYKLATALQGLVNRDKPQLYFLSFNNGVPEKYGYDLDEFWLENITDKESGYGELAAGGDLADYKIVKVKSFWKLLSMFSEYYNGLVVWDANLPSTANVAATIAGVENLLPVRFSKAATDLYVHLMQKGFSKDDIKRDLTGLFSGEGYIPTLGSSVPGAKLEYTTTPSTKSQKTDPYIWAKMFYLDTGLTHPLHMTYSVDAITQAKNTWEQKAEASAKGEEAKPELAGEIISAYIPETMAPGEVRKFSMTFQNTGSADWSESTYDRFALTNQVKVFGLYNDSEGTKYDTTDKNRIKLTKTVESGATYQVVGYIKAPMAQGEYTLTLSMEREMVGSISPKYSAKITVKSGGGLSAEDKYVPYQPMTTVDYATAAKDASIVKVGLGETVAAGSTGKTQVVVKNVGTEAWDSSYALQYKVGSAAAKTIAVSGKVESGKTCTFEVPYTAPASGEMTIELQMVNGTEAIGDGYTCSAAVAGSGSVSGALAAQIVSISAPSTLDGGAKAEAIIQVLNCGTSAWDSTVKLVDAASKGVMSAAGLDGDNEALVNSIGVEDGITVKPGDTYFFHFDLHSYTNEGTKKVYLTPRTSTVLQLQVQAGTQVLSETADVGFTVLEPCETEETVFMDASDAAMTEYAYAAKMISANMPKTMEVGELVPIRFTLKNTGTTTWTSNIGANSEYLRMAFRGAQNGFAFITNKEAGTGDTGDKNRIRIADGVKVAPGDVYTFTAWLKAPAAAGVYDVRVDAHNDHKSAWATADKTFTIKVIDPANLSLSEVEEAQLLSVEPELEVKATTDNVTFHQSAAMTSEEYKAVIMSGSVALTVTPGEKFPVSFTVKNVGTGTFKSHINAPNKPESLRLAFLGSATQFNSANKPQLQPTSVLNANGVMADKFFVLSDSSKTIANEAPWIGAANSEYTRIDMISGKTFASGESYTYTGHLVAPSTPGTYVIELVALADGVSPWRSNKEKITIKVEAPAGNISVKAEPAEPYTAMALTATAKNTTSAAWAAPAGVTDVVAGFKINGVNSYSDVLPTAAGVYLKYTYANPFNPTATNRKNPFVYYAPLNAAAAAGANGTFTVKFPTPVVEGTFDLKMQVVSISGSTETVLVSEVTTQYTSATATPAATVAGTTAAANKSTTYTTEFVSAKIPATVKVGEEVFICLTYKNLSGDMAIMNAAYGENRATVGLVAQTNGGGFSLVDYGMGLAETGEREVSWAKTNANLKNQLNLREGQPERNFPKNNTRTFTGKLVAPTTPGTYTLSFAGLSAAKTPTSDYTNFTVTVVDPNAKSIMTGMAKTAEPYEKVTLTVKAKNETKTAWAVPTGVTAPVQGFTVSYGAKTWGYDVKPTVAGTYLKYTYVNPWNPVTTTRLPLLVYYAPLSAETAAGAEAKFTANITTPVVEGNYELKTQVVSISGTTETVLVAEVVDKYEVKSDTPAATPVGTTASTGKSTTYKTEFVSARIPSKMKPGESAYITISYKNVGAAMAIMNASKAEGRATVGLVAQTNGGGFTVKDYGFGLSNTGDREYAGDTSGNRLHLREGDPSRNFLKDETEVFTGLLVAPTTPGTYTISFSGISGAATPTSDMTNFTVTVTGSTSEKDNVIFHKDADVTTDQYKAVVMGAKMPLQVDPGEKFNVSFTVKNIGQTTFKSHLNAPNKHESLRLAFDGPVGYNKDSDKLDSKNLMAKKFFVLSDSSSESRNGAPWVGAANGEYTRMDMLNGKTVASGESYTYTGSFVAPAEEGKYEIKVYAMADVAGQGSKTWWSDKESFTITVGEPDVYKPTEPTYEVLARDADIQIVNIPEVTAGKTAKLNFTVKNTGKETWAATTDGEAGTYLRVRIGSELTYIPVTAAVASGGMAEFSMDYLAPERDGTKSVKVQMVYRTEKQVSKPFGDLINTSMLVELDTGDRDAKIVSISYPTKLTEGEKGIMLVEVLNTGAETWNGAKQIALSENKDKAYMSLPGASDDAALSSSIAIEPGVTVKPGERYIFRVDLHSWTMFNGAKDYVRPGTELTLQLQMTSAEGRFGDKTETATEIGRIVYTAPMVEYADPNEYPIEQNMTHNAVLIRANVPAKMSMGQVVPVELTFKNIGTMAWYPTSSWSLHYIRLRTETNGPFDMCNNAAGTGGWTSNRDRVGMDALYKDGKAVSVNNPVNPGDLCTFKFYLKAPDMPGSRTFSAYFINDGIERGQGAFEENTFGVSFNIEIGGLVTDEETDVPTLGTNLARYDINGLMATAVGNSDYYIAHKAFFWDLAIDATIAPRDDRSQPIGTDVKVLRELLNSQRKRAQAYEEGRDPWNKVPGVGEGFGIFQVGGFVPWYLKYCSESDPMMKRSAAHMEWQQVLILSTYGGLTDADAYGTITISNCSVFSKLKNNVPKFSKNVTQAQPDFDPAVGDPTVQYDPNVTYLLYHMGDWDGSSWTANILPILWEQDPRRGEIPVGWAIAAGNSWRIPQVFNWQYDHATPNDYFIAGDNGINYYDPNMNSRPGTVIDGLVSSVTEAEGDEILQDFVEYNRYFNDIFSMDICGLLHTAGSGPSDDVVREAMTQMFPYGVGVTQEGANTKQADCGLFVSSNGSKVPFVPSSVYTTTSDGTLKSTPESLATGLASRIKYGKQFQVVRTVKVLVTSLIEIMEAMNAANPGIEKIYKVVDPYTFMRLYRESNGGFNSRGSLTTTLPRGTATIDGVIGASEWNVAKDAVVSPVSEDVAMNGRNWNVDTLKTENDLKTNFRVMWDNNYLYVLENRSDDGFIATSKTDGIDWTADAGAVYISTDGSELGGMYHPGDSAIIFNIDASGAANVWARLGGENGNKTERKLNAGEYIAAVKREGTGYVYEVAIPWSVLGTFRPTAGKVVGLTFLAIDGDDGLVGGGRQIMWVGSGDTQETWAKATLK